MNVPRYGLSALALGAAMAGFVLPAAAQTAVPLASHRAVYDLALDSAKGDKAPASANARIAFDFSGSACEGYVTNFRQVTELQPAEGSSRLSDMRSSTFEDGDAKSFRYKSSTTVDGQSVEDIDGKATKSADGALSVMLTRPAASKSDTGLVAAFPTEQIVKVIEAGREGRSTLELKVFDGSGDGRRVFNTFTLIGKQMTTPPADEAARIDALKSLRRWPVTVSYFDPEKSATEPSYVLSFELFENGISGALKLDYGDFVLKGGMSKLELRPDQPCKP